ncbi:hypothetical protein GCM10012280_71980 [Wenjunlia tyrosinilytica]|uniref:Uncharacterized protein n=1 Tax=Wenjunlia tyrosinilytica TaxID=1544741 RepID=A0A917ZYW9_9ACTN|nr:hypothetical protein GCM10012280_71980 [Wenjunlia tyrosinilytica]
MVAELAAVGFQPLAWRATEAGAGPGIVTLWGSVPGPALVRVLLDGGYFTRP